MTYKGLKVTWLHRKTVDCAENFLIKYQFSLYNCRWKPTVQTRPSTRTTFPQFDDTKSVGPKSAGESTTKGKEDEPSPTEKVAPVPETTDNETTNETKEPKNVESQKQITSPTFPVAIINL